MKKKVLFCSVAGLALAACVSTPPGPPEEVAPKVVALLDGGKGGEAEDLFQAACGEKGARDQLYPLLYEQARGRYERGEASGSAGILRFMSEQYPRSHAVREALVYALFLQRAGVEQAPPELVQDLGAAIARLQQGGSEPPSWVDLALAQQAIDRGDLSAARAALARFQQAGKETSPELAVYVEDIERYLRSHP